ncbi:hypothetical membrane protein [Salmonella phage PVPSE1]|uniref:Uncharacterized protein n=2 Tax=Seunavirus TaxID=1914851 RepID=K4I3N2_9CAUD|nr:membrane protein [Salmonella phage PVPSE1]YP_009148962.1 membrane protein [Salmonella phage SSE121]ADP02557.1 hypothetical membrane protein [Salmonella phage PVPSE1]AFU63807.1 hypothetical protein [Salmonella phage SSE121]
MPIELVIYLCIGILAMLTILALDWFCMDKISSSSVGIGLLMIVFWPLGLFCLVGGTIAAIFEEDFVIARRKK